MAGTRSLADWLAAALPKDRAFDVYHLSTPPTRTDPLYSAPPGERPDRTFVENHFLALAVDVDAVDVNVGANEETAPTLMTSPSPPPPKKVLVFALEIFLYTTARSSTLFVSKADSTGYLRLLGLPRGAPSPIRAATTAFIGFLVDTRRRPGVQFVVSLFARAQDQYLFPGSIDNAGKHVLDDRGLVRWWCRVLDPMVGRTRTIGTTTTTAAAPPLMKETKTKDWLSVKGYLVIPGLDTYETRAFVPRDKHGAVLDAGRWILGHPLALIPHYARRRHHHRSGNEECTSQLPARCLIPRFPDDPKSRFRDELDEEAASSEMVRTAGLWKSVRTVEQFWEMMAFRQECSSGRMTGFIWVVFTPDEDEGKTSDSQGLEAREEAFRPTSSSPPPPGGRNNNNKKPRRKRKKAPLSGPIRPRAARAKTQQRNYLLDRPLTTAYYHWLEAGRGARVVDESDYRRDIELLLHLDFATLALAVRSTARWVGEVGMGEAWGRRVVGEWEGGESEGGESGGGPGQEGGGAVNNLSGLIKRKRAANTVHVLEARKKPRENGAGGS